ncbi:hypothetical protein [Conexibacter arvalis]|uniref:Uncharacterized protein n=1 Tax=Conexibacter arvalis TaxID=912552 RepID=A0A840IBJ6_9ACTN|nr:hypothetical protein [Conexibacter arvalis]MBB4661438.1 hypothetical protein [Conexibacter arvalis]
MALTIKPAARAVLREQLLTELSGIGDIYLAVGEAQWGAALSLRRRYEGCMRLLDDLGWREDDPAEEFAITMEPAPLMRVLARLHERAGEEIEGQLDTAAEERQALWEAMLTVAVCGDVLVELVGTDVEEAMLRYRRERAEAASCEPEDERP